MMMSQQTLNQLIKYFRNFNFQTLNLNQNVSQYDDKKMFQFLQESVSNAITMIRLFQDKNHQILEENQYLIQEIEDMKEQILQDKKNTEKTTQQYRHLIQNLRLQLLLKQEQCRLLTQKVQNLQTQLQNTEKELQQKDLIQENRKDFQNQRQMSLKMQQLQFRQQKQQLHVSKQKYEELFQKKHQGNRFNLDQQLKKQFQHQIQHLQKQLTKQIEINQSLSQSVRRLQEKIKQVQEQRNCLLNQKSQSQQNEEQYLKSNQSEFTSTQQLPSKFQETSLLRDILNCLENKSQQKYLTKQSQLITNQVENSGKKANQIKQNINSSICSKLPKQNLINQQIHMHKLLDKNMFIDISNKRSQFQRNYSNKLSQNNQLNNSPQFVHQFTLQKNQQLKQQKSKNQHKFKIPIKQQSKYLDPYYSFFILSAQCIKINSKYFEYLAPVNVQQEYEKVLQKRIPLNQWHQYLQTQILQKAQIPTIL